MSSDENKSPREPHSRFMRRSNSESGAVNLSATQPIGSNSSLRGSGRKKHSRKPSIHRSTKCYKCKSKFTLLKKKKLCRNCGREFCKACAIDKARLPHFGIDRRVRVCNSCFIAVTALSWDKMQADIAVEGTQGVKVSLSDDAFSTLSTRREVNPESLESIQQRLQAIPKLAQRSNSMSDVSRVVRQFDGEDKTKPMHFSKSDAKALRSSIQQAKAHSNKVKNLGL